MSTVTQSEQVRFSYGAVQFIDVDRNKLEDIDGTMLDGMRAIVGREVTDPEMRREMLRALDNPNLVLQTHSDGPDGQQRTVRPTEHFREVVREITGTAEFSATISHEGGSDT